MLDYTTIAFVGGGVMAEAMVRGLLAKGLLTASRLRCSDPQAARVRVLETRYSVFATQDNNEVLEGADVIVMSIKPQAFSEVAAQIKGKFKPGQLIVSIMAGVTTEALARKLGHEAVVRVMPNTPAQIGMGISVWYSTAAVSSSQWEQASLILQALGQEVWVKHEEMLDMATALSGSAPAYFFLFMEALVDAGVHLGFSRQVARQLVVQTMKGSAEFAIQSEEQHLAHLRNMVTSPGGTTADALYQLEKGGLRTVVSKAVVAAYQKSVALSKTSESP